MAVNDFYTTSNYFMVKDPEAFIKEVNSVGGSGLFARKGNSFYIASSRNLYTIYGDDEEFDYNDYCLLIQKHMFDDEKVFIFSTERKGNNYQDADCGIITKHHTYYKNFLDDITRDYNSAREIF